MYSIKNYIDCTFKTTHSTINVLSNDDENEMMKEWKMNDERMNDERWMKWWSDEMKWLT